MADPQIAVIPWSWARLREALITISWVCMYCHLRNYTSKILWNTVKYTLICRGCRRVQSYPDYIRSGDPDPPNLS